MIDKGWAQMSTTLDRELPVEQSRKPILWVWMLGALLLVSGAIYFYNGSDKMPVDQVAHISMEDISAAGDRNTDIISQNTGKNNDDLEVMPPEQDQANNTEERKSSATELQSGQISSQSNITVNNQDQYAQNHGRKPMKIHQLKKTNIQDGEEVAPDPQSKVVPREAQDKTVASQWVILDKSLDALQEDTRARTPELPATELDADELGSIDTVADLKRDANQKTQGEVAKLSKAALHPGALLFSLRDARVYISSDQLEPLPMGVLPVKNKGGLMSPFVMVRMTRDINPKGLGYELGGGVTFGKSRLRPYMQVAFGRSTMSDRSSEEIVNLDLDGTFSGIGATNEFLEELERIQLETPVGADAVYQLSYIALETGAHAMLNRRISMHLGAGYTRYLTVVNRSFTYATANSDLQSAIFDYTSQVENMNADSEFSKSEISFNLGLGYQIGRNVYAGLIYRRGINRLISSTEDQSSSDLEGVVENTNPPQAIIPYRRSFFGLEIKYRF